MRRSPFQGLSRVLWMPLIWAMPVALLFGTLEWMGWIGYRIAYSFTLFFAYPVALFVWFTRTFLVPKPAAETRRLRRIWFFEVLPTTLASLAAVLAAGLLLEKMQPGIIGTRLAFTQLMVFGLFFVALVLAISYASAFHRDAVERAQTDEELRLARQLQQTVLGAPVPKGLPFDVHPVLIPSRQVSGDFFDLVPGPGGAFHLAIADVAGERMPAALFASMLIASLRTQIASGASVAEVVREMNQLACRGRVVEERMFATFFLAHYDPRTRRLAYTNAGHRYPVVFRRDGGEERLETGGTVLGFVDHLPYGQGELELHAGDLLLFHTDGVTDAASPAGEPFGEERMLAALRGAARGESARGAGEALLEQLRRFRGAAEARDDITFIVMKVPATGA